MEHSLYIKGLKSVLKSNGLKYSDIALKLNMTESGVKKMLNAKDISFRRMVQLCDLIGVKPSQVLNFSENNEKPVLHLTSNQENALITNRQLFIVFWRISVEKLSASEIAVREKMKYTEVIKLLNKLNQIDLVEKRKNEFYSQYPGLFKLDDRSKLATKLNKEWSELTLNRSLKTEATYMKFHRLLTLKTSEKGYSNILNKIEDFLSSIVSEAEQNLISSKPEKLKDFSLLIATARQGVLDSDP